MASARSLNNVKIFVLYLMRNVNYPLDMVTINDIVMQNDYILYLDFAEAFAELQDGGLVEAVGTNEEGDALFRVSRKGVMVAEELKTEILPELLDQALRCALQYLDFKKRNVEVHTGWDVCADHTVNVTLTLLENRKILFMTTLNVDSEFRARAICQKFHDRPEIAYRGMMALLSGNVDYLLSDSKMPPPKL